MVDEEKDSFRAMVDALPEESSKKVYDWAENHIAILEVERGYTLTQVGGYYDHAKSKAKEAGLVGEAYDKHMSEAALDFKRMVYRELAKQLANEILAAGADTYSGIDSEGKMVLGARIVVIFPKGVPEEAKDKQTSGTSKDFIKEE